jgi:hypothetical protein
MKWPRTWRERSIAQHKQRRRREEEEGEMKQEAALSMDLSRELKRGTGK